MSLLSFTTAALLYSVLVVAAIINGVYAVKALCLPVLVYRNNMHSNMLRGVLGFYAMVALEVLCFYTLTQVLTIIK